MMRTPRHLDTHAEELLQVWRSGWGLAIRRTPVGVFFRLESGLFFRGGRVIGWWWRPTTTLAARHAARESLAHPRPGSPASAIRTNTTSTYNDQEWDD